MAGFHADTVAAFDDQWRVLSERQGSTNEQKHLIDRFFSIFPPIRKDARGIEVGCGTGRFARFIAPKVGHLYLVDPAPQAIAGAKAALEGQENCTLINAPIADVDLEPLDFGYSYGVLHHIPDTLNAMQDCTRLLKPRAPFLVYLYYRFDNRPIWFAALWKASEAVRRVVSSLPLRLRHPVCDAIAALVYWPLARLAPEGSSHWPLSDYRRASFTRMRNTARDRFGTPLEQRFTREEIRSMMESAGLTDIRFREGPPYWCAVGFKA